MQDRSRAAGGLAALYKPCCATWAAAGAAAPVQAPPCMRLQERGMHIATTALLQARPLPLWALQVSTFRTKAAIKPLATGAAALNMQMVLS